jgi:RimJ/RimL family protein N-acetyltransferase
MARFVLERALRLPGVTMVTARTAAERGAATRILEKIGMTFAGEELEDGVAVWRWLIHNML